MKDKWLVISYFGNINWLAPALHIDNRLPYLQEHEINVHLLTSPCGERFSNLVHTRVPSVAPSGIRYELRHVLRRKIKSKFWFKFCETVLLLPIYIFYFLEKLLLRLDSTWSWFITGSLAAVVLCIRNKPRVIYSTAGPISAHLAAAVAAYIMKVPLIAEFHDSLHHEQTTRGRVERFFYRKVDDVTFKVASATIFLTKAAADAAVDRCENCEVASIYAGAVPFENTEPYEAGDIFTLVHCGSLAGSRSLEPFLRALSALVVEHPDIIGSFKLNLYGHVDKTMRSQMEEYQYPEMLEFKGRVERGKVIRAVQKADALLLVEDLSYTYFHTIPSKAYEYMHAGRPILGLIRNPELKEMLDTMGHVVAKPDSDKEIKEAIEMLLKRWQENRLETSEMESPYTIEASVDELVSLASKYQK